MTREEALKQADVVIEELLRSGDPAIFAAATVNGRLDKHLLVQSALRSREKLADAILAGKA